MGVLGKLPLPQRSKDKTTDEGVLGKLPLPPGRRG